MLLLATDTSGKNGSIALARATPGQSEAAIVEVVPLAGGAFSAQLVPQIAALLGKHGYRKTDLGVLAVASGPGSFTGLRVGLAAIKALAEALRKPIFFFNDTATTEIYTLSLHDAQAQRASA